MTTLAEALAPKSDQLNADDLIPGPRTLRITDARITKSDRQTRITLNFDGDNGKPFKPCKTMGRAMVLVWGITDEKQMIGKSIRVYRDPDVKFGDQGAVGGIRISHMSDIDKPVTAKLTVSQGKKANFVFQPLPTGVAEDKAAKWTTGFIAKLPDFENVQALEIFEGDSGARLRELKEKRPELHLRIRDALDIRKAELAADALTEGRPEPDGGEGFNDETGEVE